MPQSMIELAKELTLALIRMGNIPSEDVQNTLQKTYATLTALKAQEEMGSTTPVPAAQRPPVDWRKSIAKHTVTCLECGQSFKQLSIRHLKMHGLDIRSYRIKYRIPPAQPLAARDTTMRRRAVAQEIRPWEKAPRFIKARERSHPLPEPEAAIVPEETDASSAAAPAQPKRQRKTSPKKTARKTRSEG